MEDQKGFDITFPRVLRYFQEQLGRYEPSFSSKLVATHNPNMPVWDVHVLSNIGLRAPSYTSPYKFNLAETAYHAIQEWYRGFEQSPEGVMIRIPYLDFIYLCASVDFRVLHGSMPFHHPNETCVS